MLQKRWQKCFRTAAHPRAGASVAPEDLQQPEPETVPHPRTLSQNPIAGAVLRVPLLFVFAAGIVRGRSAPLVGDEPPRVRHFSGQRERFRHDPVEFQHVRHMASIA